MMLSAKVALSICAAAISLSVCGCGGGGGGGVDGHGGGGGGDHKCRPDQGQCSKCEDHKCLSCNYGYVKDDQGVPGGRCVSQCIGQPVPSKPPWPAHPFDLNGKAWPQMCLNASEAHFYGIGDWGGTGEGRTWLNPGRCDGRRLQGLDSGKANSSFLGAGVEARRCQDADKLGQKYVAGIMGNLASKVKPDYVLNVGDNFYPGGIDTDAAGRQIQCGGAAAGRPPSDRWKTGFDDVYGQYPDLKGKPWFSVLGNHDYGGSYFCAGWDEQIYATWQRDDWIMPGQYWTRTVQYADFSVEYFFLDSNYQDAHGDSNHKICQGNCECYGYNPGNCPDMLTKAWAESKSMLEAGLQNSTAEWHIIVTHFPGASITSQSDIVQMNQKYGIDLVLTGHTHYQSAGIDNDMHYIISGGGGGVTSDTAPGPDGHDNWPGAYGFVDFTINRTHLKYDMYTWGGEDHVEIVLKTVTLNSHKASKQTWIGEIDV